MSESVDGPSLPNVNANWKFNSEQSELFGKLIHTDDIENYENNSGGQDESNVKKGFVVFEKLDDAKYFEISIEFDYLIEWTSIDILSTARTVELYTSKEKEYGQTCRFTKKIGDDNAYQYSCVCLASGQTEKRVQCHSNFTIKFLSLDYPERSARQTKICVSAIIFHGKKKGEKLSSQQPIGQAESKQFSGAMSTLMSDPRMLMNLMNGMNNPTAKQMSMIVGQIMPITKTIDNVAAERNIEQEVPKPIPNLPPKMENLGKITENPVLLNEFKSKDDLKQYINDCVDERMKQWEDRLMNKMMGEIGNFASPFLQGMRNPFAGMFGRPTPTISSVPTPQTQTINMPSEIGDIGKLIANIRNGKPSENLQKEEGKEQKEDTPSGSTIDIHSVLSNNEEEKEETPEVD